MKEPMTWLNIIKKTCIYSHVHPQQHKYILKLNYYNYFNDIDIIFEKGYISNTTVGNGSRVSFGGH